MRHQIIALYNIYIKLTVNWPENDNETVENVEADPDVSENTLWDDLQKHLQAKEHAEQEIAVFQDFRQRHRLKQFTNSHWKKGWVSEVWQQW